VPIDLLVSTVASFGPFPSSYQPGFGRFVVHPRGRTNLEDRRRDRSAAAEAEMTNIVTER
jgi:hypothetical protein